MLLDKSVYLAFRAGPLRKSAVLPICRTRKVAERARFELAVGSLQRRFSRPVP